MGTCWEEICFLCCFVFELRAERCAECGYSALGHSLPRFATARLGPVNGPVKANLSL